MAFLLTTVGANVKGQRRGCRESSVGPGVRIGLPPGASLPLLATSGLAASKSATGRAYRRRTGGGATPWRSDPCEPWKAQRFPVSSRIFVGHLDGRDPFRVLVAELDRRAQTHRISKRIGERVVAVLECQQRLRMQRRRHVDTTRVVVCGLEDNVFGPEIRADTFEEVAAGRRSNRRYSSSPRRRPDRG